MNKEESKRVLIEELGIHFEGEYSLPPLAARIFANLVVIDEDGLTFEDCLIKRGASKSSISTSINLLLQREFISYFTKPGDRKKYFRIAEKDAFFLKKLEQADKKLKEEINIIKKVNIYNKEFNIERFTKNYKKSDIYMNCLSDTRTIILKTIDKLKKQ